MKKYFYLFTLLLLALGLAGCGTQTPTPQTPADQVSVPINTSTPNLPVANPVKKPITQNNYSQSYDFCENQGYEVIIRYDDVTASSKTYCRFPDTRECPADDFMSGTCNQNTAVIYTKDEPIVCTQEYDPVCGVDNITYGNTCEAEAEKIAVAYPGECKITPPIIETGANNTSDSNYINQTNTLTKTQPDWLPLVTDLITVETPKTPRSYINKCLAGLDVVYYQSNGCSDCFSVLYSAEGKVICYPGNDIADTCPAGFKTNRPPSSCIRIWTDTR